jgi:hypothetical protein
MLFREMNRRGIATKREYRYLNWNQDTVRSALDPFKAVAETVPGNKRTSYTEAGGYKIARSKDDPEWTWIDSYSAIKAAAVNAILVCYVRRPGDEAEFQFQVNGELKQTYNADRLEAALAVWKLIAADASRDNADVRS